MLSHFLIFFMHIFQILDLWYRWERKRNIIKMKCENMCLNEIQTRTQKADGINGYSRSKASETRRSRMFLPRRMLKVRPNQSSGTRTTNSCTHATAYIYWLFLIAAFKKQVCRAPGWLSQLSGQLRLRSWSRGPWVRAPRQVLCWQLGAWSLLRILCLPLSPSLPRLLVPSLSLTQINKNFFKKIHEGLLKRIDVDFSGCNFFFFLKVT